VQHFDSCHYSDRRRLHRLRYQSSTASADLDSDCWDLALLAGIGLEALLHISFGHSLGKTCSRCERRRMDSVRVDGDIRCVESRVQSCDIWLLADCRRLGQSLSHWGRKRSFPSTQRNSTPTPSANPASGSRASYRGRSYRLLRDGCCSVYASLAPWTLSLLSRRCAGRWTLDACVLRKAEQNATIRYHSPTAHRSGSNLLAFSAPADEKVSK